MVAIAKRGPELREAAAAAEAARATDPYAAVPLLPDIARIEDLNLGDSEASAVQRINANASLLEMLIKAIRKHRPDLAQHLPPDALEQVRKLDANRFSA